VKLAEDSDDIIVRVYESFGGQCTATLKHPAAIKCAVRCNILEEEISKEHITDGHVTFTLKPFEVVTLKLSM